MNNRGGGQEYLQNVLRREYAVHKETKEKEEALIQAAAMLAQPQPNGDMVSREQLRQAVETLSDGTNTVLYDDYGMPSIMFYIPPYTEKDVLTGSASPAQHPAFMRNGKGYWVGKYQCSMYGGQACSLPLEVPLFGVDFDTAVGLCRRKGKGWNLVPFALRMAIALRCRKNGFLPHGNNNRGTDFCFPEEHGLPAEDGLTLCGSGPVAWAHNGTANGLYDLNGNLNEWDGGFRLIEGEIQIIPVEALLAPDADVSPQSPLWCALDEAGTLVAPGTPGTLKYDAPNGSIRLTRTIQHHGTGNCAFADIQIEPGLTPPSIAFLLGLCPQEDRTGYGLGWRWISTKGESLPLCGGAYRADDHAGVFFVGATYPRTKDYALTGLRTIYIPKEETL